MMMKRVEIKEEIKKKFTMIQILALVWWGCGSVGVGWISDRFGVSFFN